MRLLRACLRFDEIQDARLGGLAGRLLRPVFGLLRMRGDIDGGRPFPGLFLFDGYNYDDGEVPHLLHVRVPDVDRPHGEGEENRCAPVRRRVCAARISSRTTAAVSRHP